MPSPTIHRSGGLLRRDHHPDAVRRPLTTSGGAGETEREDYVYRREVTRNLFLAYESLAAWRHVTVTERRTTEDFAH